MNLYNFFDQNKKFKILLNSMDNTNKHFVTGLVGSSKPLFLKSLFLNQRKTILFITDTLLNAQNLFSDLSSIYNKHLYIFPAEESISLDIVTSSPLFRKQRLLALNALGHNNNIIITSTSGIRRLISSYNDWQNNILDIKKGININLDVLTNKLITMGYKRKQIVNKPGEFSVRGSIIDIYTLNEILPIRIDFFDTEVSSIRYFYTDSQQSVENINRIRILPASDVIINKCYFKQGVKNLETLFMKLETINKDKNEINILKQKLFNTINNWENNVFHNSDRLFLNYFYPKANTLVDYLSNNSIVIFDDYKKILRYSKKLDENKLFLNNGLINSIDIYPNYKIEDINNDHYNRIFLSLLGNNTENIESNIHINTRESQNFLNHILLLKKSIHKWLNNNYTIVILAQNKNRVFKISEILNDYDINFKITKLNNIEKNVLQIVECNLENGFESDDMNLVVLTENSIFPKSSRKHNYSIIHKSNNVERLKRYSDLKKGDYVVHVDHGVGIFLGVKTIIINNKHRDYLIIEYQKSDKLYVPVDQLNRVQKYISSDAKAPHLNYLGGTDWYKTKRKISNKIDDIADYLIDLYSERKTRKGFAFPKDDEYQEKFENDFIYSETVDQLNSIREIKKDMESSYPMDRLLVGDVGYGKTEVALRAAFKAINAGKQVALLVPTTVLAQQHYDTIIQRFKNFPIQINIFTRFNSLSSSKMILSSITNGSCDFVIGTHRLLSSKVKFKNLGLLIIDEEQRFGVKHKEFLKKLKSNVDVLTLTATPIPRTLNMSMLGVRDLSIIETPPPNRYPIQTYVLEQNNDIVFNGIQNEIQRGGQVFYLYNRVKDMSNKVYELKKLVPESKIAYINGQMSEYQMEDILVKFINKEYDVLVTTTIIETGIDIPNVNTLFVENSDTMGLSQLYQLRGRIGRSNKVAYAYFMYRPNKILTEISEKRLEAIKDFTELGSGFKLAMRDLSIRGAGNLLGKEQHGFIDAVGYDLYIKMLNEAINKKKGLKKLSLKTNAKINLNIDAYIPNIYIHDDQQKIEIYKRLKQLNSVEEYNNIKKDLLDRFGKYPKEVNHLLEISLLKMFADKSLVDEILCKCNKATILFSPKLMKKLNGTDVLQITSIRNLCIDVDMLDKSLRLTIKFSNNIKMSKIILILQKITKDISISLDNKLKNND